ncbi:MAG: hypothetical protein U1F41_02375 [Burkholderiales bacterium]
MDRCIGCCYYDRQNDSNTDSRGVSWGQCRRTAPALHPINQKTFMIEGVWPHVRDDDWCGEFRGSSRRADPRPGETLAPGSLLPIATGVPLGPRAVKVSPFAGAGAAREAPISLGPAVSSGSGAAD